MATAFFSALFRRRPEVPANAFKFPYDHKTNPYRSKKAWPPDFSQLSQKHQFRLERRYRRRTKLKWARPTWNKGVQLAQWASILFVGVYGVLYLEVREGETVFHGVRRWYGRQMGDFREMREGGGKVEGDGGGAATQKG
ncbi:hypothetical protein LTR37_020438 [Vermiconidia calcicola]|uniref:Uncharacterized protein n=1 Tax=Vermiconidia calcicola TaxID=1690605 RepID=A0ACC3MB92_9PEZI|nr:hypothetical protein LTR37_020438 [Vermiconidia calcicola]